MGSLTQRCSGRQGNRTTGLAEKPPHRWPQRERRYHYPREALGLGYEDFEVVVFEKPPQADTPAPPEPKPEVTGQVQEPEEESMSDWLIATLCLLMIYAIYAYLWAALPG